MSDEYYYFDLDAGVVNLNLIKKIEQNYEKKNRCFTEGNTRWNKEHQKSLTPLAIKKWNSELSPHTYQDD